MRNFEIRSNDEYLVAWLELKEVNDFLFYFQKLNEWFTDLLWPLRNIKVPLIGRIKVDDGYTFDELYGSSPWELYLQWVYYEIRDFIKDRTKTIYIPLPYYYLYDLYPDDFLHNWDKHSKFEEDRREKNRPKAQQEYKEFLELLDKWKKVRR